MAAFSPGTLAQWTGGHWTVEPGAPLDGFTLDTREVRPGQIFVAIKTDQRDGHQFLAAAQAAGAGAALVAKSNPSIGLPQLEVSDPLTAFQTIAKEHRRKFPGPVVGISGSAGKTSTKNLLALLLGGEAGGVLATAGNLNNHLGVPLTLTLLDPAVHRMAVIEAGISAPGDMRPLADMIEPDVSLITLVAAAHTKQLGGIEGVACEKAVLPAATRPNGFAIFPKQVADFTAFQSFSVPAIVVEPVERLSSVPTSQASVQFSRAQSTEATVISVLDRGQSACTFSLRRVSDGMAQNAVLAICVAIRLGVSRETIQARLNSWSPAKLRGEIRHENGRMLYVDCYNANPASMADALETFAAIAPADEPRLYVIGCMEELGAEAPAYHRKLGRAVPLRDCDRLFVIGTHAHEVCAGVLDQDDFTRQINMVAALEPVAESVAAWRGSIFVKGSRRYQLEKVLVHQSILDLPC